MKAAAAGPGGVPWRRRVVLTLVLIGLISLGALAYSYFATPASVATSWLVRARPTTRPLDQYQVGAASWGIGSVSYAVMWLQTDGACHGSVILHWQGVLGGWAVSRWTWDCVLGHP